MDLYTQKYLNCITLIFIILGAVHLGIMGFLNVNILKILSEYTFIHIERILYIIIGIAVILNIFSIDYYLPFLGDSVFPCGFLVDKIPLNANIKVLVHTPPHSKVIYWAAESKNNGDNIFQNPDLAYGEYTNTGVTKSDGKGLTVINVRNPSSYKTPFGKLLKPHIHYRICTSYGMLSGVKTVFINPGNAIKQEHNN